MVLALVELDGKFLIRLKLQFSDLAIDTRACEAVLRQLFEFFLNSPLRPRTMGAITITRSSGRIPSRCSRSVRPIALRSRAALMAMRRPDRGIEKAKVVVDLGDGAHRGARAAARGLLLDGDGRRQAVDRIHIRPLHLVENWRAYAESVST